MSFKGAWGVVKTVVRNLPVIRQEIVSAVTAAITLVGVFEVTFPQVSTPHLALFATITAALTGVASFLSNSRVVTDVNNFSDQPVWKAKLRYLVKGPKPRPVFHIIARHEDPEA
jgi:hypothetical protein